MDTGQGQYTTMTGGGTFTASSGTYDFNIFEKEPMVKTFEKEFVL